MIFTTKEDVGEQTVSSPTSAIIKDVDNLTQCTPVLKAQVVASQTIQSQSPQYFGPTSPLPPQEGQPPPPTLPTPVQPTKFTHYLQGYDHDLSQYIIQGFTYGFKLNNTQSYPQSPPKNLKSSYQLPHIVDAKLSKESSLGRIAGPFPQPTNG